MKVKVFLATLVAFALLHQDTWLWNDSRLVLGFLPSGLVYHAGYSLATAILWAIAIRHVWPGDLEVAAPAENNGEDSPL